MCVVSSRARGFIVLRHARTAKSCINAYRRTTLTRQLVGLKSSLKKMACKIILSQPSWWGSALGRVDTMASARARAKARLREALRSADDRATDPNVIAAVEALSCIIRRAPAKSETLFGYWYQLNANEYPGDKGVDEAGNRLYNGNAGVDLRKVFEPKPNCRAPWVKPRTRSCGAKDRTSSIIRSKSRYPSRIEGQACFGLLVNEAECEVLSDERLGVRFTGSYLLPRRRRSVRARGLDQHLRGGIRQLQAAEAPTAS